MGGTAADRGQTERAEGGYQVAAGSEGQMRSVKVCRENEPNYDIVADEREFYWRDVMNERNKFVKMTPPDPPKRQRSPLAEKVLANELRRNS
jgi:hypothetical protein